MKDELLALAERLALRLSNRLVRECVESLRGGEDDWVFKPDEAHRTCPYPMGFYATDDNLYYAIGRGRHWTMWPWERWLAMRTFARSKAKDHSGGPA